jgi:hypothetical protein
VSSSRKMSEEHALEESIATGTFLLLRRSRSSLLCFKNGRFETDVGRIPIVVWVPEVRARSVGVSIGVVWGMLRSRVTIFLLFCRYFRGCGSDCRSSFP